MDIFRFDEGVKSSAQRNVELGRFAVRQSSSRTRPQTVMLDSVRSTPYSFRRQCDFLLPGRFFRYALYRAFCSMLSRAGSFWSPPVQL